MNLALTILLAALAAAGQLPATLSSPQLGYVWSDAEKQLRPLQGTPGSAVVGDPVDLGFTISQAAALNGRRFLASTDAAAELILINMNASAPSVTAIPDAPGNFSQAVGSLRGSAAAVYYDAAQAVFIVTGLPTEPRVAYRIDLSPFGEPLTHIAVNDSGNLLIYSLAGAERDTLYAWTSTSGFRLLTVAENVSAITLTPNGDAIVAAAAANQVFSILDPRGSAVRRLLADETNGISNPVSVATSATNRIHVANAGTGIVLTMDYSGRVLRNQACECELSGLYPLRDLIYRMTERIDRPIFLLETGGEHDHVTFIPRPKINQ